MVRDGRELDARLSCQFTAEAQRRSTLAGRSILRAAHYFFLAIGGLQMQGPNLDRRNFTKLAAAALGGMVAGASVAMAADDKKAAPKKDENPLLNDKHICRGLNTCKGKGKDKKNDCAGRGTCAVAKAHTCHGSNDCKGQGGCGEHPGENTCKGKGECNVPLKDKTWTKARKRFEALMKEEKKDFGPAPKAGAASAPKASAPKKP